MDPGKRATLVTLIVALGLTGLSVLLHMENRERAGGLWRDEASSVALSSAASFAAIYENLQYDSFPLGWFLVLRGWIRAAGAEDPSLRTLGLIVGLACLAAIWRNGWLFAHRIPLVTLLLLGVSGAVIRYGDSLRAYGAGILTGTLMFGSLWNLTRRITPWSVVVAVLSSLLAVHSVYNNAVFLFAVCMGGVAVMWMRRSRAGVILYLAVGALCVLSLLPYLSTFRLMRGWIELFRYDLGPGWFLGKWKDALEMSGSWTPLLWTLTFLAGLAIVIVMLRRERGTCHPERERGIWLGGWCEKGQSEPATGEGLPPHRRDVAIFCGTTLLIGTLAYWLFLEFLSYETEPWYYLTLMTLIASSIDPLFGLVSARKRMVLALCVALIAGISVRGVRRSVRTPQTNIDLIAAKVTREASARDLVFLFPWQYGVTFQRYYRGAALWQTIPPIATHKVHRYDQFKAMVSDPRALARFLEETDRKLEAGGRIWIVSSTGLLENSEPVLLPLHKPRLPKGDHLWRMRLSVLLSQRRAREGLFRTGAGTSLYENAILEVGAPRQTSGKSPVP